MIRNLIELRDTLNAAPAATNNGAQADYGRVHGLSTAHGMIDWTSLPTFGGTEPTSTVGVWSWDAHAVLVGDAPHLRIEPREAND